jgi:uncharacterized protein YgbK (DUF1537 family)
MTAPEYGWFGDDFTGATDTLAELATRGLGALLFLGLPDAARLERAGPLDAVGIAGATRSMAPTAMAATLRPVGEFFQALGVRLMHYKCCSTFDSAPEAGNLGTALASLAPGFPHPFRPVVGGQPNLGRYLLFANLFAAAGTGGTVHRIDRHPTMSRHPVTPMGEADLRLHLAAQGVAAALLPYPAYGQDVAALEQAVERLLESVPQAVLMDVSREEDLAAIGALLRRQAARAPLLAVGPSSVAQAWCAGRSRQPGRPALGPKPGPVLVLAGSLSPVTRAQVEAAPGYRRLGFDPGLLAADPGALEALAEAAGRLLEAGEDVLLLTETPGGGALPPGEAAAASARLLAAVLRRRPVRRLGIAGGDTSSIGVQALDLWGLSHAGTIAPGVALCHGHGDDPALHGVEIMLKGGQMGAPDLLAQFRA